jgi:predicted nucleotidyltransferase
MARRAAARVPTIRRALLFGSLVSGIPTPRSDADILVEVSESRHARPQDRLPEILRAMTPLPCPVDLFVLTSQEIVELGRQESPLVREALAHGEDLL